MEGRPQTALSRTGCSHIVGLVVNVKGVKSDIYLSLSVWHSTSITNFPQENLLSEVFSLMVLSFIVFILRELFTLSLSSTLSLVQLQP